MKLDYIVIATIAADMLNLAKDIMDNGERANSENIKKIGIGIIDEARALLDELASSNNNKTQWGLVQKEIDLLTPTNGKIPAIKAYRERTGAGLAEAKTAIEHYMSSRWGYESFPIGTDGKARY